MKNSAKSISKEFEEFLRVPHTLTDGITVQLEGGDGEVQLSTDLSEADFEFLSKSLCRFYANRNKEVQRIREFAVPNDALLLDGNDEATPLTECTFFEQSDEFAKFVKGIKVVELGQPNSLALIQAVGCFDEYLDVSEIGGYLILPISDACCPVHYEDGVFSVTHLNDGFETNSLALALKHSFEWYKYN